MECFLMKGHIQAEPQMVTCPRWELVSSGKVLGPCLEAGIGGMRWMKIWMKMKSLFAGLLASKNTQAKPYI